MLKKIRNLSMAKEFIVIPDIYNNKLNIKICHGLRIFEVELENN